MDTTPVWIMFVHHFMAGLLMPWLGLVLISIKPRMKSLLINALMYGLIAVFIRHFVGIPFNIAFLIQIVLLVVCVKYIWNLNLFEALTAAIFGVLALLSGESLFLPIIYALTGLSDQEIMNNNILLLFLPLPQLIMNFLMIILCLKNNFHLFAFKLNDRESLSIHSKKRMEKIAGLVLVLLMVLILQMDSNMSQLMNSYGMFKYISPETIGTISAILLVMGVIVMVFLIVELTELTQKESQYHLQSVYVNTLDELYTAIRSERHDVINHLQTVYGFTQLGYTKEVQDYLSELLGGNILTNEFVITGTPGLTALFYIKSGMARANGIKFHVNVDKQIDNLNISPYELNNILGNLINNAFDAVILQDASQRLVNVYIGGNDDRYEFKVANNGYISDALMKEIFEKGFSTKTGEHIGLGLHIAEKLVRKYGGHLQVCNTEDHMVEFSFSISQYNEKGYEYEYISQENSSFIG